MFKQLVNLATGPIRGITSGAVNQLSNFGNMLTGNVSPSDFVENSIKNVTNAGYQAFGGTSSPFGDGSGGGFKGILNQTKPVAMNAAQNQSGNAMQTQAQDMRQSLGTINPFNNYGGFSSMLTGQGNFAPGQNQGSMYGRQPLSKERFGDNTNQSYAPQAWR